MANAATSRYYSIRITQFLMKTVGFWNAETKRERFILDVALWYMLLAFFVAISIEFLDFYYSWGDLYAITYTACSTMPLVIILIKVANFTYRREDIMRIIKFTKENFWYNEYDAFGKSVLDDIDKKGIMFVCSFTFFVQGTVVTYMLSPITENIGKNMTDRILPFKIWLNLPLTTTPYFEILFAVETLALVHSGLCFCCFDNFLTILCIHVAGQFKILQYRIETIFQNGYSVDPTISAKSFQESDKIYDKFKGCVLQHRLLIAYMKKLEETFSYTTLSQLLISSLMLCVAGFQVCLGRGSLIKRMIFIAHTLGCFFQILIITLTLTEVIRESSAVGDAAYKCNWESAPYESYKKLRDDLMIMMIRSKRPCYITAGGFSPVSLETFMGVISTAASYFTLLRNLLDS